MKLVLLPGMDGTGKLFSPLIRALSEFDCKVIRLPETGSQDYSSITASVRGKLPEDDFVLVVESFSGPIGSALAREGIENMKGIIFVATFLSAPRKVLLSIAHLLPLKFLSTMPFSTYFHKILFLGSEASSDLVNLFKTTVNTLPTSLIKARLSTMFSLQAGSDKCGLPAGYIQAVSDNLVLSDKVDEFKYSFKNMVVKTVDGPHFILQAKPAECAVVISELFHLLTRPSV